MRASENLELRDRIADLHVNVQAYRELARAALETIAVLSKRNTQRAERIKDLNDQLRAIFQAPCRTCQRANRSERAA